jgi:hypothetical protein
MLLAIVGSSVGCAKFLENGTANIRNIQRLRTISEIYDVLPNAPSLENIKPRFSSAMNGVPIVIHLERPLREALRMLA